MKIIIAKTAGFCMGVRRVVDLAAELIDKKENIFYEDLCFQLQQAVEKAIKGYLIHSNIEPPRTHSFKLLIKEIEKIEPCPVEIERTIELEDYAIQTRYPGDYASVEQAEYNEALEIATNALDWIRGKIR